MVSDHDEASRHALQEAEARHRQILNSATDTVIISTDLNGCVTSWNEGARRIIGYTEAEMLGQPVDRFFTAEDQLSGRMRAEMTEALTKGHSAHEGWRVREGGERFWASGQIMPLRSETGIVTGFIKIVRDRTIERRATEALERSQEQLRLAQSAGGIGTFVVDVATDVMTVTPEFCRLFGLPVTSTMKPGEIERLLIPEDQEAGSNPLSRTVGTAVAATEYRIRRADNGSLRWIARKAEFVRAADGQVVQMLGVAQDITERKLTEQALAESEAKFRTLAQAIPNLVWTATADGRLDWFNDRIYDYSGLTFAELNDSGWMQIVHPDDLALAMTAWEHSLHSGVLYETEYRIRRSDGSYRWHIARATPVIGDQGIVRWVGTNTDIEEQKTALKLLAKSNETLESQVAERTADRDRMWRLSTDVMLVADFDGVIHSFNPAWTRLLGWTETELVGSNLRVLVHPDDHVATKAEMLRLEQGMTTPRFENRCRAKDGHYRTLSWTAVPENGLIHAVGRDITAEKEATAELEQAQEALRQAQKMEAVGQLTGGIAHDFNNLLTGIIGSLDLMQRRIQQGQTTDLSRYAMAAMTSANRAAALTHRLLAFSRRQPLAPKPVDANHLVSGMEELLGRTLGEAIRLRIVTAEGLWQTRCDPHQLENAILNLAINARDAMPNGGGLTIETCNILLDTTHAAHNRDVRPGEYVGISVIDTGCGMPADVIAKAFDPFFTTKPLGQGTGLGLSMIYGFVRQSEGHVMINSEIGRGTTVTLYLPRHQTQVRDDTPARPPLPERRHKGRGEVVLVVEDEAAVRGLIIDILEELGYQALEAEDGPSGLEILQSGKSIDLLITDVGLPGLNGRQLADAARHGRPGLKILFMTGYAENTVANSAGFLEPGMEMLTKPFTVEVLAERVRRIIRSRAGTDADHQS